jgi:hypothetical protein
VSESVVYTPAAPPSSAPAPTGSATAQPQTALITFRDTIRKLVPSWLRGRIGGGILYAIAVQMDALADAVVAAVKVRFPGLYSFESLPILGRDRRIRRGRLEPDAIYAVRLRRWLDDHRRRGGPYALLAQVHAFYAQNPFEVELRYFSGRRFEMDADGNVTRGDLVWSPPGNPAAWARWWLYYQWPDPVDDDGLWSDPGTWDDGGVWDSNLSAQDVRDIRLVPREWNAAHAIGRVVIVSPLHTVSISIEGA